MKEFLERDHRIFGLCPGFRVEQFFQFLHSNNFVVHAGLVHDTEASFTNKRLFRSEEAEREGEGDERLRWEELMRMGGS
jgi:hypothetical protein